MNNASRLIGERLRDSREQNDIDLELLSDRVGLSVQLLDEMESGNVDGRFVEVMAVAIALDTDLADLLSGERRDLFEALSKIRNAAGQ